MQIIVVTHGKHERGGFEAKSYDGPLTGDARRKVHGIQIPEVDAAFCGEMRRHRETVAAMGLTDVQPTKACGWDEAMFAMLEGDEKPVREFRQWIQEMKARGYHSLLIVTSRGYAIMLKYFIDGGEKRFGPFGFFLRTIEAVSRWPNTSIHLMESGVMHIFEM